MLYCGGMGKYCQVELHIARVSSSTAHAGKIPDRGGFILIRYHSKKSMMMAAATRWWFPY